MTLIEKIKTIYPNISNDVFLTKIILQNDTNGLGDYIKEWNHLTYPRPTQDQLKD